MAVIDLPGLFVEAFGYEAPKKQASIQIEQAPARAEYSNLGQPYYDTDLFGREFFLPVRLDGVLISFAVVGCVWKKTYVSTGMPERGGTVHELISIDDYAITIKGILITPMNDFPEAGLIEMHNIFVKNQSIELRSALTDIFLSGKSNDRGEDPTGHRVIIKEITWPEVSGVEHAKPFSMTLESDLIFDLEID